MSEPPHDRPVGRESAVNDLPPASNDLPPAANGLRPAGNDAPPADLVLNCLGRPCPVPIIELARALRDASPGWVVEVVSDDPAAQWDVPAFCRMRGYLFLGAVPRAGGTGLQVRQP